MALTCSHKDVKYIQVGKGAYGTIYSVRKSNDHFVLKVAKDASEERSKHLLLWVTLPDKCKKYFVKPLDLPKFCRPTSNLYSMHAMEYVSGVNMHEYVKYNLALGNREKIKFVTSLLKDALMCLWKSGFIHMDLHMQNIIITSNSIKIIDFGMTEKVEPLKNTPKTKAELEKWFSERYITALKKLGMKGTNPNLYAYGIKKHKMYYKPNQQLYNKIHAMSSIKRT